MITPKQVIHNTKKNNFVKCMVCDLSLDILDKSDDHFFIKNGLSFVMDAGIGSKWKGEKRFAFICDQCYFNKNDRSVEIVEKNNPEQQIRDFVFEFLSEDISKTIVDVGANLRADFSKQFIEEGWSAVLIEPQKSLCNHLKRLYPNANIINKGCGDKKEVKKLYLAKGHDSQLATFNSREDDWFRKVRGDETIDVDCDTLTNILDDAKIDNKFAVLKVDTESWDYYVFKGLDFNKYQPEYIISEDYFFDMSTTKQKYCLLEDSGYVLLGWVAHNTFWARKNKEINYTTLLMKKYYMEENLYPKQCGNFDQVSPLLRDRK